MSHYDELDFINPLLSDEELLIRGTVRDFVNKEILPYIKKWFVRGEFPKHLVPQLGSLGILGGNLALDGYIDDFAQISEVAYGLVMQELERADSGIRSFASVQGALTMFPILEYGSEEQKNLWLPQLYAGTKIGCFGLSEEHGGSDPSNMKTRASKVEGGYVLNGKKVLITNGEIADIAVVWAINESGKLIGFLIPKDAEGFSAEPMVKKEYKNSMRVSYTSYLIFEDCFVPETAVLPKATGQKAYLKCLTKARYGIGWGVIGAAYSCFEELDDSVLDRILFGKTLAEKQLVQYELAAIFRDIEIMQSAMLTLGRLCDKRKLSYIEVSVAKFNNPTKALKIARRAAELLASNRISDEYSTPRHLRNLEAVETYEGTRFIHALIIGAHITGKKVF